MREHSPEEGAPSVSGEPEIVKESDRFNGQWGTPDVLALFERFGELQIESGLHAIWVGYIQNYINAFGNDSEYFTPEELAEAKSGLFAELPFAMQVTGPISKKLPDGSEPTVGYQYSCVKVDPHTGTPFGEWSPIIDLEDDGTVSDLHGSEYTSEQIEIIKNQVKAQTDLGVVVNLDAWAT